jgi:hypothetical protein
MLNPQQWQKMVIAMLLLIAATLPACVLSDRDSSPQEEYYIKNFRNNPNKKGSKFRYIRNDNRGAPVDIVPQSPYGEMEDTSIPNFLLFIPLVGAWMAALVLIRQVSPGAATIVSKICRKISEYTRTVSERTAAMHEKNKSMKRKDSSSRRRDRNHDLVASDQSISPSLIEIATVDEEFNNSCDFDNSGGTSLFSSFRRAKTVVASNLKHERHNVLREPSPSRRSPSKHKPAPTRLRRSSNEKREHHELDYERYNRHTEKIESNERESHQREYNKNHKHHREQHVSLAHKSEHVKSKPSHKHDYHDSMSPLEKKLSNGSQKRSR